MRRKFNMKKEKLVILSLKTRLFSSPSKTKHLNFILIKKNIFFVIEDPK